MSDKTDTFTYGPFRLEIGGSLQCLTPLHIGTGDALALNSDAPVLRDARNCPYVPGSTLKGVLRAHLTREACLLGLSYDTVTRLFGDSPSRGQKSSQPISRLTVFDATRQEETSAELRDHVKINPLWGAAETGAKFDAEVVLPPASFGFCAVYEGESLEDDELVLMEAALRFLQSRDLRVGAKCAWGYGQVQLQDIKKLAFNRRQASNLVEFFKQRLKRPFQAQPFDFKASNSAPSIPKSPLEQPLGYLDLSLAIQFDGPALVKSSLPPAPEANSCRDIRNIPEDDYWKIGQTEADHVFILRGTGGTHYLPGSSLRGVFRSQALRICCTLFNEQSIAQALFGYANDRQGGGQKGLIEVFDGELTNGAQPVYLDHVAIDRITNAAIDSKKFSTCGLASPQFSTTVRLRFRDTEQDKRALALFGFVLRDLMAGRLWAGSGSARGFGHIQSATVETAKASIPTTWSWKLSEGAKAEHGRNLMDKEGSFRFEDLTWLWEIVNPAWPTARKATA